MEIAVIADQKVQVCNAHLNLDVRIPLLKQGSRTGIVDGILVCLAGRDRSNLRNLHCAVPVLLAVDLVIVGFRGAVVGISPCIVLNVQVVSPLVERSIPVGCYNLSLGIVLLTLLDYHRNPVSLADCKAPVLADYGAQLALCHCSGACLVTAVAKAKLGSHCPVCVCLAYRMDKIVCVVSYVESLRICESYVVYLLQVQIPSYHIVSCLLVAGCEDHSCLALDKA